MGSVTAGPTIPENYNEFLKVRTPANDKLMREIDAVSMLAIPDSAELDVDITHLNHLVGTDLTTSVEQLCADDRPYQMYEALLHGGIQSLRFTPRKQEYDFAMRVLGDEVLIQQLRYESEYAFSTNALMTSIINTFGLENRSADFTLKPELQELLAENGLSHLQENDTLQLLLMLQMSKFAILNYPGYPVGYEPSNEYPLKEFDYARRLALLIETSFLLNMYDSENNPKLRQTQEHAARLLHQTVRTAQLYMSDEDRTPVTNNGRFTNPTLDLNNWIVSPQLAVKILIAFQPILNYDIHNPGLRIPSGATDNPIIDVPAYYTRQYEQVLNFKYELE